MSRFRNLTEIDETRAPPVPENRPACAPEARPRFLSPPFLSGEVLEQFLALRDSLLKNGRQAEIRAVGVTSSKDQEGKSSVAIGLALTLAGDTGKRVLLIDGNMRAPFVHEFFRIPVSPGLSDLLTEAYDFRAAVVQMESFPLCLLPAGTSPRVPPSELLALGAFPPLMNELKKAFDIIVMDTPSARKFTDVERIGKQLDGVILVVENDKTQLPLIHEVKKKLETEELPILGVVLSRFKTGVPAFLNRRLGIE